MPKKKLEPISESELGSGIAIESISELSLDLGRADLNALVDKVNEVIRKINNGQ